QNLRHRATTMDSLVSVGTLAAFGWSVYALVWCGAGASGMKMRFSFEVERGNGSDQLYLEVASAVTAFLLAGRYFEARAKRRSGAALRALLSLGAKHAAVLRGGVECRVPVADLVVGDRFVVRPGEKVATDGIVEDGESAIDSSVLTGESVAVDVSVGDDVVGATINTSGRLVVRATRVGDDTALAQLARLVSAAQSGKAPVQRLADRISAVFVPTIIVLALGTIAGWLISGASVSVAFAAGVAVLIIACPCALGLATPTALLVGTGRGAQLGIIIKGPEILESTRQVDTIVLDKTGTVTSGEMSVVGVVVAVVVEPSALESRSADGAGSDSAVSHDALRLAGSLEAASEHPIARAIAVAARERFGQLAPVERFVSLQGLGVSGVVDGQPMLIGRSTLLAERGITVAPLLCRAAAEAEALGRTPVFVARDDRAIAVLVVADSIRTTSAPAVQQLRRLGLRPILLTGDNERAATAVARQVGIDPADVIAGVLPEQKVEAVSRLQGEGKCVAMVGDGVNDAAALARADLGIAMGTGTDVAIEASDLTLVRADLGAAVDAIRLSRRTLLTIKANLAWAFGYNIAAIPLAAAGLLNPLIAGSAMALSSVFVVSNSLRLHGFRPTI
ncbi:MAG: heavy metal translocating P-type ATPase, partial [Acidothermaceae bacterium]